MRRLRSGQLDLIFIKESPDESPDGVRVSRDSMVWVGHEKTLIEQDQPVPVVAYQAPSFSRQVGIDALEAAGRTWRITCNSREVSGLLAAVRAGLGVAVFPHSLIPEDLVKVTNRFGLPTLGEVDFTLLRNPSAPVESTDALISAILGRGLARG